MAAAQHGPELYSRNGFESEETRRLRELEQAVRTRKLQALNLQRENILSQRTSNAGRRAALESALKQIEDSIAELG